MIKKIALTLVLTLTLSSLLITSGCIVAAVGIIGAAFYAKSDQKIMLKNTPTEIAAATEEAFLDLKITKLSATASDLESEVTGRNADGKKITVTSKSKDDGFSSISIRVGMFGDEGMSDIILMEIKKNL
jgi:sensor histidine kinase regulating citrate/malate metabolism